MTAVEKKILAELAEIRRKLDHRLEPATWVRINKLMKETGLSRAQVRSRRNDFKNDANKIKALESGQYLYNMTEFKKIP